MGAFKDSLKKILPPPVNSFMREVNRIVAVEEQNQKLIKQVIQKVERQEQQIQRQNEIIEHQKKQIALLESVHEEQKYIQELFLQNSIAQSDADEMLKKTLEIIKVDAKAARNHAWKSQKNSEELLWAEIFHDTSSGSKWLYDKAFSAGRWAVGYQYLYAVYRILNEVKPKSILELGLGQSTRLLGQYASAYDDVLHMVVEHDPSWIDFFQKDFALADNTNIVQLEREYIKFREDEKVLAFKDFYETFKGQKFDFISIDAPLGSEAIVYARIDILSLLPECLADSFVIVVDDYNRHGEKNMVAVLESLLQENNIAYKKGVYSGQKDCIVICSDNFRFLCSM